MTLNAEPVSGHSRGKLKRQRAIIDAARDIMAESGEAGLTMFAVAQRAGVSPATPYNLFGSKQTILQAIYDEDMRGFAAKFEMRAGSDPLEGIFSLVDLSIEHWRSSPDFYRAMMTVLTRTAGAGVEGAWQPRRSIVRKLIDDLAVSGGLVAEAPLDAIGIALIRTMKAIGQEWVNSILTLDQAGPELGTGFGVVLTGFVTPGTAPALARILKRYRV